MPSKNTPPDNRLENRLSEKRPLIIITGLSGAGLSTALKTLEDLGYEAVDNLRLSLIENLINATAEDAVKTRPLAISLDARTPLFAPPALLSLTAQLKARADVAPHLLYLDCDDEVLLRRFHETRRRHPLAADRPVLDGLQRERQLVAPLRAGADRVLDTSLMTLHDLRRVLAGHYRPSSAAAGLTLHVTSFAYKFGVPREADFVLDVRFLRNPHWVDALRAETGQHPDVAAYVRQDSAYAGFLEGVLAWLLPVLARLSQEGRSYLTLAAGCTGGRHRSVVVAEDLTTALSAHDYVVGLCHRDAAPAERLDALRRLNG